MYFYDLPPFKISCA